MKVLAVPLTLLVSALLAHPAVAASTAFSIDADNAPISDVLQLIQAETGTNLVADPSLKGTDVTIHLQGVSYRQVMLVLVHAFDLQTTTIGGITLVGKASAIYRKSEEPGNDFASRTVAIPVHSGKVEEIVRVLSQQVSSETIISADTSSGIILVTGRPGSLLRSRHLIALLDRPSAIESLSEVVPLRYARSSEIGKTLKGELPEGSFVVDDVHNAIALNASRATIALARTLLQSLDTPSPQVMFEVKVADISSDAESRLGILLGGQGSNSVGTTTYTFQNKTIPITATLDALVTSGQAQILAQPRLATLNNREASMLVGENYPIEQQTISGGATSVSVSFIDVGVKLRITPTIGADGTIIADLHPEFSAIAGTDSFGNPIVTNRRIDATLRVQRDETIVFGGMLREDDETTLTKLPFLGDLPILGYVFRNRQKLHTKDDVIFLITPHVL